MKRVNGEWYVNACLILVSNGRDVKASNWQIAGTFERACLMMGGHHI
jgi:hypothetical protein